MFLRSSTARKQLTELLARESCAEVEILDESVSVADAQFRGSAPSHSAHKWMVRYSLQQQDIVLAFGVAVLVFAACVFVVKTVSVLLGMLLLVASIYLFFTVAKARESSRRLQYAVDLPTVFLSMASNMKIGLPAYSALEKSTKLFGPENVIRVDSERFLAAVQAGIPAHEAIKDFGEEVGLEDIELFKKAFILVLEHGGRFAPTLERLARLGRERALLSQSLQARTSGMRMTANVLLLTAPGILLMLSARIDDYWEVLLGHPVASVLASLGVACILMGYFLLKRMGTLRL